MLPTAPTGNLEPLWEAAGMSTESKGGAGRWVPPQQRCPFHLSRQGGHTIQGSVRENDCRSSILETG